MRTYLGLDLGTSATKGVILSDDGHTIARARVTHPSSRQGGAGRAEPKAWEESVLGVCQQLAPYFASLGGVGIDTHCPTVIPLDAQGQPATLGVTWDHPELAEYFTRYSGRRSEADLRATGNHPSQATFAAVAYHFLREREPEAFARMTTMGFAGTWLGNLLTGKLAMDPTQASYSGVFDTIGTERTWLESALRDVEIAPEVLPPVRQPLDILGEASTAFASLAALPRGIPVVVGSADTPAASYALGTSPGKHPFLIMGTTHVVNSCLAEPDLRATALHRRGLRRGEWLINGVTNGGDELGVAATLLGFGEHDVAVKDLVQQASTVSATDLADAPLFVPHLMPERGPMWLIDPRSGIHGLTRTTTRAQLARSVVEGVLLADRMVLETIIPPGDEAIYLTGAFGRDPVLPQMLADATGRSFDVALEPDLPAIGGAAMCAEAADGTTACHITTNRITPSREAGDVERQRWASFKRAWSAVTRERPLPPLALSA